MTTGRRVSVCPNVSTPIRGRSRGLLVALFLAYLVMLAWLVLWKLDIPYVGSISTGSIKLVPFLPSAGAGGSAPLEVAANVLLFVPFGVYLGLLVPAWQWPKSVGAIAATSMFLEATQLILGVGVADVSDVIANAAGGLAGLGVLALARRRLSERTTAAVTWLSAVGTVLALIAVGVFVMAPHRYRPIRDVGPLDLPSAVPGAMAKGR